MNVENLIVIISVLLIWSHFVQWTVPSLVGRYIIGIFGSITIGIAFAMNGITVFGVQ